MAAIVKLPGVKGSFAVGLSWRHEESVPGRGSLHALAAAKGRWAVIRKTSAGTVQVGLCDTPDGMESGKGMHALAAVVADLRPQPWMGVYRLAENQYWYIAVRDAQEVLPDGDQVGTLEEISRVRQRHLAYGEWIPIEGSIDDLCEMAMTVPVTSVLRDMRRGQGTPVLLAVAFVLGIGVALATWRGHERAIAQRAWLARQHALAARAPVPEAAPWRHEPRPSAVLGSCGNAWQVQPLATAGWTLTRWRCELQAHEAQGLRLTTSWTRSGGLANAAPGVLAPDAQHASASTLVDVSFEVAPEVLLHAADARRAVWSFAQTYGLRLEPESAPTVAVLPGATPGRVPAVNAWSATAYRLTLDSPPWPDLGNAFDAVPGLRINRVDFDFGTLQWTVSATLYAWQEAAGAAVPGRGALAGKDGKFAGGAFANGGQP
ncbi:type 4b pilus protein PilO2 [Paraburkholderia sp. BCC1885]|uniref:type 4b pilus protein PilO2 n=1 Tax=Paraburkholderia sp. BCC1885 TaxID=2562669 RepID=UPI001183CCF9|nr:type 4b pilus protein PilO2 [Paraburkholderia sp. BCC1885]